MSHSTIHAGLNLCSFIDAFVLDALYPCGSVLTKLHQYNYGAFVVLKKENNEPFKEALALWDGQPPCEQYDDPDTKEHINFWNVDEVETLDTFKGKVRVVRTIRHIVEVMMREVGTIPAPIPWHALTGTS